MNFEVNVEFIIVALTTLLVIEIVLIPIFWRLYKDKIQSIFNQRPTFEELDLNYQLKDHTPRI